jgi:hypothetical protein
VEITVFADRVVVEGVTPKYAQADEYADGPSQQSA